jgi:hypothetical protein
MQALDGGEWSALCPTVLEPGTAVAQSVVRHYTDMSNPSYIFLYIEYIHIYLYIYSIYNIVDKSVYTCVYIYIYIYI